MLNYIIIALAAITFMGDTNSIHNFSIKALNSDKEINLSDYKGKKILMVNVASKCGYTPQYEELQKLASTYKDDLVVIGFPCNQFMGQELKTEAAIEEFCTSKFEVDFPMTTIIDVKGKNQHPIYAWLTQKELNGKSDHKITWNFNKFLIDEDGSLLAYFPSKTTPMSDDITSHLK